MLMLQRQGDIKKVTKRGGHRACFHATMLITANTVFKVTFGDLHVHINVVYKTTHFIYYRYKLLILKHLQIYSTQLV